MEIHSLQHRIARRGTLLALLWLIAMTLAAPAVQAADPLILGVFPRFNPTETTRRYTPLADYLRERLGRELTLVTSKDFVSFWRGIEEQRYDIVQCNQYHYIRSAKTYRVIAHNKEFGKSTIAGTLYVRKDSGITSLAQLRGRTVLFGGGDDAMISYIAPVYLMLQAGLKKEDFKTQFAVNPVNSVIGVFRKQADAAGSGDMVIGQPALRNAINADELTALAVSEQLLHLPWTVRRTMSVQQREAIQLALVNLENSDAGKNVLKAALLTGIGKADDRDYDPARKMVQAVMGPL
jgi:phosphonate transport system substrate-binding protein